MAKASQPPRHVPGRSGVCRRARPARTSARASPAPGEHGGRDAVVDGGLDEQIRHAPDERGRRRRHPRPASHAGDVAAADVQRAPRSPSWSTRRSRSSGLNRLVRNRSAPACSASDSTSSPKPRSDHRFVSLAEASSARSCGTPRPRSGEACRRRGTRAWVRSDGRPRAPRPRRRPRGGRTRRRPQRGGDQLADELVVIDDRASSGCFPRIRGHRISEAIRSKTLSSIELNASTTRGSNCVPLPAVMTERARNPSRRPGGRGGRW